MSKKKEYVLFCSECKCNTRHVYLGRERQALLREVVLSILTLGLLPLWKIITGEKIGGTTFWGCTECCRIREE